eukprot:8804539-Pyramimonas_sp.AAC.1
MAGADHATAATPALIHLIGTQAGRNERRAAASNGPRMTSSLRHNYNCGCELWASLTLPCAATPRGPLFLQPSDFHVISARPRLLTARIQAKAFDHIICVAHDPHEKKNAKERKRFLGLLNQAIIKAQPSYQIY